MKIVINKCYGGFGLSDEAWKFLGINRWLVDKDDPKFRTNKRVIECVEKLGKKANGEYSALKIVEVPDDVDWIIEEYDGVEWVSEVHRTWD